MFDQDFVGVRARLQAELSQSRITLGLTLVVALAMVGVIVYLATRGWLYISVPLLLAVIGSIGHAVHKRSVLREHLRALDRRHVPLPKATVHVSGPSVPDDRAPDDRARG